MKEQQLIGGTALHWADASAFVELTISRSIYNMVMAARLGRTVFFGRGIIDQISGLEQLGRPVPPHLAAAAQRFRANETVFMVPPWQQIYRTDSERRHSFADAEAAYATLWLTYSRLGYRPVVVPRRELCARADFVLSRLGLTPAADYRSSE